MSFKIIKLPFIVPAAEEQFYTEIKKEVNAYFAGKSRYANKQVLIKAAMYTILVAATYAFLLQSSAYWQLQLSYWSFGFASFLFALNFAHDAAHHSLTGKRKLDDLIYEILFNLQGANGYLWRIRHNHSHHAYPNVDDCDADLQVNGLIALSPNQHVKWHHRYQHLYAPIAYMFYTVLWIFYKDFVLFFRKKQANILFTSHPVSEWIKFVLYKLLYIGIYIVIPYFITGLPLQQVLAGFFIMHCLLSLFLLFTFLISHYVEGIVFTNPGEEARLHNSWARHQVNVSVDFHAEERWAGWIFGGFNTHVAHHLFPHVCHVHYPYITRVIREKLVEHGIPYQSVSYWGGVRSHLRFIKQLGTEKSLPRTFK
ncbi:MAG TPA: acyl-CoA desaturase [Chitinophagaceae bacterium]|nr:acyl-CoA desaturase [Chitinophagaceae bacterium]